MGKWKIWDFGTETAAFSNYKTHFLTIYREPNGELEFCSAGNFD